MNNNNKIPFITYFFDKNKSISNHYENCFLNLKTNMKKFNYNIIGEEIDFYKLNLEKYEKINLYRPTFILKKIEELKSDVIWIDADSYLLNSIKELKKIKKEKCDIALFLRKDFVPYSACLYFNKTEKSINFLKQWEKKCIEKYNIKYNCTEHCLLLDSLKNYGNDLKILNFSNVADHVHEDCVNKYENKNNISLLFEISKLGIEYEQNNL